MAIRLIIIKKRYKGFKLKRRLAKTKILAKKPAKGGIPIKEKILIISKKERKGKVKGKGDKSFNLDKSWKNKRIEKILITLIKYKRK